MPCTEALFAAHLLAKAGGLTSIGTGTGLKEALNIAIKDVTPQTVYLILSSPFGFTIPDFSYSTQSGSCHVDFVKNYVVAGSISASPTVVINQGYGQHIGIGEEFSINITGSCTGLSIHFNLVRD